jgi:hypothetical protein
MKSLKMLMCIVVLALATHVAMAGDGKGKSVDVAPVDVPEKIVIQPTSAEIHEDAPPDQKCGSCHGPSSVDAEKKPLNHFVTTKDCGTCHFNKSWVPLRMYTHQSGRYQSVLRTKPDADIQDCASCHFSNNEFMAR